MSPTSVLPLLIADEAVGIYRYFLFGDGVAEIFATFGGKSGAKPQAECLFYQGGAPHCCIAYGRLKQTPAAAKAFGVFVS